MLNDPNMAPHLALLQIHIGSGDGYTTTWGNNRDNFYNVTGTPTAWFDGITSIVGAGSYAQALSAYTGRYNTRRLVPTNVKITLTGVQQSGSTFYPARQCGRRAGCKSEHAPLYGGRPGSLPVQPLVFPVVLPPGNDHAGRESVPRAVLPFHAHDHVRQRELGAADQHPRRRVGPGTEYIRSRRNLQ